MKYRFAAGRTVRNITKGIAFSGDSFLMDCLILLFAQRADHNRHGTVSDGGNGPDDPGILSVVLPCEEPEQVAGGDQAPVGAGDETKVPGAFLAAGSVNSPETSNYHLEISLNSENYAKWLSKLFARYKNSNIEPKIIKRRDKYVIYFKKSDQISNFLIIIGAVSSCLEFEDVRANRDLINNANRLTNMDTANKDQ